MQPRRFTCVMEQTLGHVAFAQNLRRIFEADPEVCLDWLPIEFPHNGWLDTLPVLRNNWSLRGSLKARRAIKSNPKPHLYFIHTPTISLLSSGWLNPKTPLVLSLDATPLNYDRVGAAYGHKPDSKPVEQFKFWLNYHSFHGATRLTSWSEWAKQSLVADYGIDPSKVEVVPPGTDLAFWKPPVSKEPHTGKLRLLFVGGDFERKGGKLLYDVFQERLQDKYELHLVTKNRVLTGDGIFLYDNIAPNSPELQQLFHQSDVFVLPTQGDCMPLAITEAMAAGLPVVSSKLGAIEEMVIQGKTGYVITPGNAQELGESLLRLATDDSLRQSMGQQARLRAEAMFDATRNGQHLLALCKSLIN